MDNTIGLLIKQYLETKNEQYFKELATRFQPLINVYANKLYYLEKEDSIQELTIALYEAILKIKSTDNEYACISYIKKSVIHKFCKLYYTSIDAQNIQAAQINADFNQNIAAHSEHDIQNCIYQIDLLNHLKCKSSLERSIICLLSQGYSDDEIAHKLGYTRQYINRIKKRIIEK